MIGRTVAQIKEDALKNELNRIEVKIINELIIEPKQLKALKYEARKIRQSLKMPIEIY